LAETHPLEKLFEAAWKKLLLDKEKNIKITVGVSGGVDSMVLLCLLTKKLKPSQIVVAHFDHLVRPESSLQAQELKRQCTNQIGVKQFILGQREGKKTDENSLRFERHAFLKRVMRETSSHFVVLGHHANDQLETLLMRWVRGTGIYGLSGMSARNHSILRPLLRASKKQILDYAKLNGISVMEDESNHDHKYFRNQVRHRLIPVLEELSQSHGGESKLLFRTLELSEEVSKIKKIHKARSKRWIQKHVHKSSTWWSFSIDAWQKLSEGVRKFVADGLWDELVGETLEKKELKLLNWAAETGKTVSLSGSVRVVASFGVLYLQCPKQAAMEESLTHASSFPIERTVEKNNVKYMNERLLKLRAEIRFLKPGDKFQGKKMKRRCWEDKIPSPERVLLPVVALQNSCEVIWYFTQKGEFEEWVHPSWSSIGKV